MQLSAEFTKNERAIYNSLFKKFDVRRTGIITSEIARSLFKKSGLPSYTLEQIWNIVDPLDSCFDYDEFCVALRLIGYAQDGVRLCTQLKEIPGPLPHFQGVTESNWPALETLNRRETSAANIYGGDAWVISPEKRALYDNLFNGIDHKGKGSISRSKIAIFFLSFHELPKGSSDVICQLSDINKSAIFTKSEFAIAMLLYEKRICGAELPRTLPKLALHNIASPRGRRYSDSANYWVLTQQQIKLYDNLFDGLEKNARGLKETTVSMFLINFNVLYHEKVDTLYRLVGVPIGAEEVTRDEFVVVMFLVHKILDGVTRFPSMLPDTAFPRSHKQKAMKKKFLGFI